MPASSDSPDQHSGKLPPALLWAGVGVSPLAALVLVVGSSQGSLRFAIGLALLAVVLIGLSIALRPTVESVKVDLEDSLYDEVDVVREDMRNDIATAARATHRSFGEKYEQLQAMVDQLRGQLDAMRAEMGRPGGSAAPANPIGAGLGGPPRPNGAVPGGVVRHTETVQVTTRSTIVDPHSEEPPPGRSPAWAGAPGGGADTGRRRNDNVYGARPEPEPSYEESWTEQQLRKRLADAEASRTDSGDRWASVRADERGRELRMGERRTSMHADESGAEVRYEDRWATVRRDNPDDRRWTPPQQQQPRDRDLRELPREVPRDVPRDTSREPSRDFSREPSRDFSREPSRERDRDDDRRGYGNPYRDGGRPREWDERDRDNRDRDNRDRDNRESGWENRPRALPSTSDALSASDFFKEWTTDSAPEPERRRRRKSDD